VAYDRIMRVSGSKEGSGEEKRRVERTGGGSHAFTRRKSGV